MISDNMFGDENRVRQEWQDIGSTAELRALVDPIAANKWSAGPITLEQCVEAVKIRGIEERPWQSVIGAFDSFEENRDYHLRRI